MNAVNQGTYLSNFDDDDDRSIFTSRHCQVSIMKRKTYMRTRITTGTGILNYSKQDFFVLQKPRGGHILPPPPPPAKTMLTFSESTQVKVF